MASILVVIVWEHVIDVTERASITAPFNLSLRSFCVNIIYNAAAVAGRKTIVSVSPTALLTYSSTRRYAAVVYNAADITLIILSLKKVLKEK